MTFRSSYRLVLAAALLFGSVPTFAQGGGPLPDSIKAKRWATENELQSLAVVNRKVMITMRDGIRIPADIYVPKDSTQKYPAIWVRTPYNFNYWDVQNGVPRDMSAALYAIKRGYAYVDMQERGHFFAEGNYDILGAPLSDGDDELNYLKGQRWSSGKIGTTGCSSTAEWQPAVASLGNSGFAAMNVQGFGAGVGKVGPYYEMGNWYRGGAVQMLFIDWLMGEQNQVRPMFPASTSQAELIRVSKSFDLAQHAPPVDWAKAFWTLPEMNIMTAVDGPHGIFADSMPVPTGGAMIKRAPNDPAWYKGGLWHENMPINIPGLWFMSWYDVSVGPNVAMYNHVMKTAKGTGAGNQWMIIAPVAHCSYTRATEHTVVGERDMGDARLGYQDIIYTFFDQFLKGNGAHGMDTIPKVHYYVMGKNEWRTSDVWPVKDASPMTFHLGSGGNANTLNGDGRLALTASRSDKPDKFAYDPLNPVGSHGGNVCCQGNAVGAGSMAAEVDQARKARLRIVAAGFVAEELLEFIGARRRQMVEQREVCAQDVTLGREMGAAQAVEVCEIGGADQRGDNDRGGHLRPNNFSISVCASFTQVGRPWLHWPECGVTSISRRSAFISATERMRPARTEPWQAMVPATASMRSLRLSASP